MDLVTHAIDGDLTMPPQEWLRQWLTGKKNHRRGDHFRTTFHNKGSLESTLSGINQWKNNAQMGPISREELKKISNSIGVNEFAIELY